MRYLNKCYKFENDIKQGNEKRLVDCRFQEAIQCFESDWAKAQLELKEPKSTKASA